MKEHNIPKIIKFFENSVDNVHCLQSCVKSLLCFYFPNRIFTDEEIDNETVQKGGWSWLTPAAIWLHRLGLNVTLYSKFNYEEFALGGEEYLKKIWDNDKFVNEQKNGSLKNILLIQKVTKELISADLWKNEELSIKNLKSELGNKNTFAIGKTIYEWLNGQDILGTPHYVLVKKEYAPGIWSINDPGLPGIENRKIQQTIGTRSILLDTLLIKAKL